MLAANQKID